MRKLIIALSGSLLLSAQAAPGPITTHFRAYTAAIQAGDMATADREADAALQASIARSGNGGRTAVLALNLAQVRIVRVDRPGAYGPAKRAFDIASANPGMGVDPLLARLVLGQAELTPEHEAEGLDRLFTALPEAVAHPELQQDAYQAAVALGNARGMRQRFEDAAIVWDLAARYAAALSGDHQIPLAEARTNQGMALINRASENNDRDRGYEAAGAILAEPLRILAPLANVQPDGEQTTVAQEQYARTKAWFDIMNARLARLGRLVVENPEPPVDWYETCQVHMQWSRLELPSQPRYERPIGVVVLRMIMRNGEASGARVVAAVPGGSSFERDLTPGLSQWTARVDSDDPDCLSTKVIWRVVRFRV